MGLILRKGGITALRHAIRMTLTAAAAGLALTGCGLAPKHVTSTDLGFTVVDTKPAKHLRCQRLSVRGDVLAYVSGETITLYRKKEGIFFYGKMNRKYLTESANKQLYESPDACFLWNIANWEVTDARYYAFNHPYYIDLFDKAEQDPQKFFNEMPWGPPYFGYRGTRDGEQVVSYASWTPANTSFEAIANEISTLQANKLFQGMDDVRRYLSPAGLAAAKAQRAASNQAAAERKNANLQAARQAFTAAATSAKSVGVTVCSADNRIAFVEQISGSRIKLSILGRAMARLRKYGELGPYDVIQDPNNSGMYDEGLIVDPYFLFYPLTGTISVSKAPETLWDDGSSWARCDYR